MVSRFKVISSPFMVGDSAALFHITVPWLLGFVEAGSHSQLVTLPILCSKTVVAAIVLFVEPLKVSSGTSGPAEGGNTAVDDIAATRRSPRLETSPGFSRRPSSPPLQPVAVDSGAAGGGDTGGADSGGPGPGGHSGLGSGAGGSGTGGVGATGIRDAGAGGVGGTGAAGTGGAGAGGTRGTGAAGAGGARARGTRGAGARGVGAVGRAVAGGIAARGSGTVESYLPDVPDPESDLACATSPTVTRFLATLVTDPSFESTAASSLVTELVDFAASYHLDYVTGLVTESESDSPPSIEGELTLGSDVLEDRQFEH
ncbi:unnamed protein product [Closterium sp. NIES-54]